MSSRYALLLALVLLLLGCVSQPSPKDAMLSSIEKTSKLGSVVAEMELNFTVSSSDGASAGKAEITQYIRGDRTRSDLAISGIPGFEGVPLRAYSLDNGSYMCSKGETWECMEFEKDLGLAGEASSGFGWFNEKSRALMNSSAIEFIGGVEKREVAGRPCSFISARINYSKAGEQLPLGLPKNLKSAAFSECLDDETGIALSGSMLIETDGGSEGTGGIVSQLDLYVAKLEPNATISDNIFELPGK